MFRALSFRPESPSAPGGAGDGLGSPDGFRPKSERKRGTGSATGPFSSIGMQKRHHGDLVGDTAGMLLKHLGKCSALRVIAWATFKYFALRPNLGYVGLRGVFFLSSTYLIS
jgi:hypothetical protein